MRQLHLVENEAQPGHVVLATSDGLERFELAVDQALRKLIANAPAPASTSSASGEPRITPREIQMRVRAGEAPEQLAATFETGLDWVMRFAGPVIAERIRIADEARRARARRSTTEGQIVVFGEAVDERFGAHGIDPSAVGWDSHRREDGQWIIAARWVGGQSQRQAEWAFQLSGRMVAPLDDTAADLLSDRPIRPIVAPAQPPVPTSLTLAPPLAPGVVAFPSMPDAHTARLPATEDVFDQNRIESRPGAEGSYDEPPLPLHVPDAPDLTTRIPKLTNLGTGGRAETDDERAARASIPSWDDILLGVRRPQQK